MTEQGYPQNTPVQPVQPQYIAPAPTSPKAIASLVLGILGLICMFLGIYAFIGVVLGIIGLVVGIMAKKEMPSGAATAGIVLSIIAIALCLIFGIACTVAYCALVNSFNNGMGVWESLANEMTDFTFN